MRSFWVLCAVTALGAANCGDKAILAPGKLFVTPGDFGVEGFLDDSTYQAVGMKIAGQYPVPAKAVGEAERRKQARLKRWYGQEWALFLARLSAYSKFTGRDIFTDDGVLVELPDRVRIGAFLERWSDRIPPLSFRLKSFLEGLGMREEIVLRQNIDELVTQAVVHYHRPDLVAAYPALAQSQKAAQDLSLKILERAARRLAAD